MRRCIHIATTAFIIAGCSSERTPEAEAVPPAAAPGAGANTTGLIAGTPPGGLVEWVEEIRAATSGLPELAITDPAAAQKKALDTYIGRQEYIEMYWGEGGRLTRGSELAPAVMAAEARFHELMQALPGTGGPVDGNKVRTAVVALSAQYDKVLAAATAAGVTTTPSAAGTQ
jgi:hypothetical protein